MEEALEMANYLPIAYKTRSEGDYIEFLWDAFETNYTHAKYQFAFLACHIAHDELRLFQRLANQASGAQGIWNGLIGFGKDIEKSPLEATSPFVFCTVNERTILRFLKLIECDNSKIGTYVKLVDERNESAHPNGNIFYSEQSALEHHDSRTPPRGGRNSDSSGPVIEECCRRFLPENHDPEDR